MQEEHSRDPCKEVTKSAQQECWQKIRESALSAEREARLFEWQDSLVGWRKDISCGRPYSQKESALLPIMVRRDEEPQPAKQVGEHAGVPNAKIQDTLSPTSYGQSLSGLMCHAYQDVLTCSSTVGAISAPFWSEKKRISGLRDCTQSEGKRKVLYSITQCRRRHSPAPISLLTSMTTTSLISIIRAQDNRQHIKRVHHPACLDILSYPEMMAYPSPTSCARSWKLPNSRPWPHTFG